MWGFTLLRHVLEKGRGLGLLGRPLSTRTHAGSELRDLRSGRKRRRVRRGAGSRAIVATKEGKARKKCRRLVQLLFEGVGAFEQILLQAVCSALLHKQNTVTSTCFVIVLTMVACD